MFERLNGHNNSTLTIHDKMSKIFILLMVFIPFMATPVGANANATASEALLLLNDVCMNADADLPSIKKIAIEKGGVNIRRGPKIEDTEPPVFLFNYFKRSYLIQIPKDGACSIIASNEIDSKHMAEIMQKNYPLSKPEIEYSDVSVITVWYVAYRPQGIMTYPPPIGAILLRVKKESKGGVMGSLIFLNQKSLYEKDYE